MVELNKDEWLGARIGKPCYRLTIGPSAVLSRSILQERMEGPRGSGAFVYAHVASSDVAANRALAASDFVLVETSVELSNAMELAPPRPQGVSVRRAVPGDNVAVAQLAYESFTISRFHADPLIADSVARQIKRDWVANFFAGKRGTDLLVAHDNTQVTGFLLLIKEGAVLKIDLIAVRTKSAGMGYASAMLKAAGEEFRDCSTISVTTELRNLDALRLYTRNNFAICGSHHAYHIHY